MYVGVYRVELHIPTSQSLKAKRSVINSLKTKLATLGISVAEVDGQDTWQRSTLGLAAVSNDVAYLDQLPDRIESICLREPRATFLRVERTVLPVEDFENDAWGDFDG